MIVDCNYPRGDGGSGSPVLVWDSGQGAAMENTRCDSHERQFYHIGPCVCFV